MYTRTRGLAWALLAVLVPLETAAQQQGSVQITAAAQAIQGDTSRTGGQPLLEPDYGVSWLQPGTRFGIFQLELRGTRRDGLPHLGKTFVGVRDLKYRGLAWSFEAGDTYFTPAIGDYRFANLAAPSLTFVGGGVSGRSPRTASASSRAGPQRGATCSAPTPTRSTSRSSSDVRVTGRPIDSSSRRARLTYHRRPRAVPLANRVERPGRRGGAVDCDASAPPRRRRRRRRLSALGLRHPRSGWIGPRRCQPPTAARLGADQCGAILARRSADPEPAIE